MASHNFRTNTWRKKNQTAADHYHFLMNSTNAQRSFIHELASQQLGHAPSALWGVPIPHELHQPADTKTLQFIQQASRHSAHEFGRLLSSHKKASGWGSALGSAIGRGAKTVGHYMGKVGKFIGEHGETIRKGVGILSDMVSTGAQIAAVAGVMDPDSAFDLGDISALVNQHVQGDHYGKKKVAEPKKGGYFNRIMI